MSKSTRFAKTRPRSRVFASSVNTRITSWFPSVWNDSEIERPAKMSSILPIPTVGIPAAHNRSRVVSSGGGRE